MFVTPVPPLNAWKFWRTQSSIFEENHARLTPMILVAATVQ